MRTIENKDGEVILHEDLYDMKIGRDLQFYIKKKADSKFIGRDKYFKQGMTQSQKEVVLHRMADYFNQKLGKVQKSKNEKA